jgi:hypothetical protein
MEKIEKLLNEHYLEFTEMINDLYDEKYPPQKSEKIITFFKVNGKKYDNKMFTKNYISFLNDLSYVIGKNVFKSMMGRFVEFNPNKFPKSVIDKNQHKNINNCFYVSTYTTSRIKISHIKKLCKLLDIKIEFEYMNNLEMA